jgi:peptide/nickel transport system permease protein
MSALASDTLGFARTRGLRLPRFLESWSARIAFVVLAVILGVAFVGPFVTPHSPTALVGGPYASPSSAYPLGTDYIGEDVLSRCLAGGSHLILYALVAIAFAYLIGAAVGLLAGFSRSILDPILMRLVDLLLAFPAIFLVLILAARYGSGPTIVIIGITFIHVPLVARLVRTATLEVSVLGYVEAAVARGDSTIAILRREILPNIVGPLSADAGPRLTTSILLVASLNFLGVGVAPPAPSWSGMISENTTGLGLNPWAVIAPAILIGILTVSVNVVADAVARGFGHSSEEVLRK